MHELRELHAGLRGVFITVNGESFVGSYGDPAAEGAALWETAGVIDLSGRGRLCLAGADRQRFLNGQVTNNVKDLQPGQGCYAALVTAKGKMESDLYVWCLPDELLLDFEPGRARSVVGRLEKYVIADDVQVTNVATHYGLLVVQGPHAHAVFERVAFPTPLPAKAMSIAWADDPSLGLVYCANNPRGPMPALEFYVPVQSLGAVFDKLVGAARALGGRACGWEAWETFRIEAGIPRFGVDMDGAHLAPETGLETRAISYSKGCYIGQEVIARIRTYGQVAKALRGLRLDRGAALPRAGDKLFRGEQEVGSITSAVFSARFAAGIAMGYVRKEHNAIGTQLTAMTAEGPVSATVATLPLTDLGSPLKGDKPV